MFILGMMAMYFLLNVMIVIYILITEGKDLWNLKKNRIKIYLIVLSMFFVGLPYAVMNKDSF